MTPEQKAQRDLVASMTDEEIELRCDQQRDMLRLKLIQERDYARLQIKLEDQGRRAAE